MKKSIRLYHLLLFNLVLILSSCSNENQVKVKYSFKSALNINKDFKDYEEVEFKHRDNLNLGFFKGNIWIKLDIENQQDEAMSYMFYSNDRFNRNYTFYKVDTIDNIPKIANPIKNKLKNDNRTFNNPNPNFKIDLGAKEKATFLIISDSDGRTKDVTPTIISIENYFDIISENTYLNILFYGIIICLLIINLYQWSLHKQYIYFYYIFYIASTCLVYLGIEGHLHSVNLEQKIIDHFIFITVKLWALSLIIYTAKFFEIQLVAPVYYKFIKIVLLIVLGGTLIYQFTFYNSSIEHLHYFENVLSFLWLLLIIGIILFSAKTKKLELKYYLIPFSWFIIFTIIGLIDVHLLILPGNSFTYVKIGAIIELIGFTYFISVLIKRKVKKVKQLEYELSQKRNELNNTSNKLIASKRLIENQENINKTDLINVIKIVENSFSSEADWNEFKLKFKELNPNFHSQLISKHPKLTKSEIRLLTLIRIGYSQKEIAAILNIAPDSVKKAKSRVRKKLELTSSTILKEYLENI